MFNIPRFRPDELDQNELLDVGLKFTIIELSKICYDYREEAYAGFVTAILFYVKSV